MNDLRATRKIIGLKGVEISALLGSTRASVSKVENYRGENNKRTRMLFWVLAGDPQKGVSRMLDFWIHVKPKNWEHMRRLMCIARRFKEPGIEFNKWEEDMRVSHPEFFLSEHQRRVAASVIEKSNGVMACALE